MGFLGGAESVEGEDEEGNEGVDSMAGVDG